MNYLRQVQAGIDFIESNLESNISPNDVARHAGISQWHFQRIFKALTNETLKAYIRARRLANSLDVLLNTDLRIADIALNAGYENQESYTRAFRQAFDMTPSAYRSIGRRALFMKKIEIDEEYIRHIHSKISLEPTIRFHPERLLIGLRTQFYSVDSEKNNIAAQLPSLWDNFLERIGEVSNTLSGACYGVLYRIDENNEQLNYMAGIEVSRVNGIPDGMELMTIPESCYAQFEHRGQPEQLNNTVNFVYCNWLLNSEYIHSYGPDIEIFGSDYLPASSDSIIHYAIPKKKNYAKLKNI